MILVNEMDVMKMIMIFTVCSVGGYTAAHIFDYIIYLWRKKYDR